MIKDRNKFCNKLEPSQYNKQQMIRGRVDGWVDGCMNDGWLDGWMMDE